jgi:hypothetical protein
MMIAMEKPVVSLYVDKSTPEHWIVRDQDGQFWMVPPGEKCWDRRQPFHPTEETGLDPIPAHYKYMLGLPV